MNARPNILWIVTDHQVKASWPQSLAKPPLQQYLASRGVEFTHARTVLPVCSPARASMLTGLYPHKHALTENDGRFGGRENLSTKDWLLHRALQDEGYRCSWFGKWHVDNRYSAIDYGFEGFSLPGYGYPYATAEYQAYLERKDLPSPVATIELAGESGLAPGTEINLCEATEWFDYESGVASINKDAQHEAYFVADIASQWLDEQQSSDQPFFMRVDCWGPHPPYVLGPSFQGALNHADITLPPSYSNNLLTRPAHHRAYQEYWQQTLGLNDDGWRCMFQRALEHTLLVENALRSLLNHVDLDNTVVIFCSDHGDAIAANGAVSNKGGLMNEATMQIPLYVAGAGVRRGVTSDTLVCNTDITATVMDMAGLEIPETFHSTSLLPVLKGSEEQWPRDGLLTQHYGLHDHIVQRAWYEGDWKLVVQPDGFAELYNLASDPFERSNLALSTDCHERLTAMRRRMVEEMHQLGDPITGNFLS